VSRARPKSSAGRPLGTLTVGERLTKNQPIQIGHVYVYVYVYVGREGAVTPAMGTVGGQWPLSTICN
jgi:hypothetical protein